MRYYLPKNPQQNTSGKLRVTQVWNDRAWFYKQFWLLWHEGIDLNPKPWIPTPLYAVFDGNCYMSSWGAYWNRIKLYDDVWLQASYCHCSKFLVNKWQRVKAWDLIWYSGNTASYSMPLHLHFMIKECNAKTWAVYNTNNWYLWSVPIYLDANRNELYVELTRTTMPAQKTNDTQVEDLKRELSEALLNNDELKANIWKQNSKIDRIRVIANES